MKRNTEITRSHSKRKVTMCCQRLGLAVGGTLFGLLVAELILHLTIPAARLPFQINTHLENERGKFCRYDATLGWAGRPNIDDLFVSVDSRHQVRQNRYGFRGVAYPFDRSSRRRLLVLGDSFVWGYGVEEEQMFTTLFERRVEPPQEVVNLGVSGYGTDQELLLYRELGRQFQADQVLLVVTPYTDLKDNTLAEMSGYPKPLFKARHVAGKVALELSNVPVPRREEPWAESARAVEYKVHWLCRLAARSSLIATTIQATATNAWAGSWLESRKIVPPRSDGFSWEKWTHISPPHPELEQYCQLLFLLIDQLHTEVIRDGAQLALLLVPSAIDVDPELWERFKARSGRPNGVSWDRDHLRRRLIGFCADEGIDLIDPTDALRQAAPRNRNLYFPWNRHWTPVSHKIVSELLGERLPDSASAETR